jgi:hypothetical protein
VLEDRSGGIKGVAFGNSVAKILEVKEKELEKEVEEKSAANVLNDLSQKLIGKELKLFGNVRENPMSNEKEFLIRGVLE